MLNNMSLRWKLFLLSTLAMGALTAAVLTGTIGIRSGIRGIEDFAASAPDLAGKIDAAACRYKV